MFLNVSGPIFVRVFYRYYWHADPLLGKHREISKYTTAVAK